MIGDSALRADASPVRREALRLESDLGLPAEILQPVIEGARARGMAEAFEAMGRPVVFLDGAGNVLYVAPSAERLFGDLLAVTGRQLVASSSSGNSLLQSLVADALQGRIATVEMVGEEAQAGPSLRLSVQPGPAPGSPAQLLRAIIFLDAVPAPQDSPMDGLTAA